MKKEFLFNKIILLGCLLFSFMVMFSCDDDPEQTDREYMATGTPHPHLNQREIREAENFDIDGHHYEWIRYCKEGVGLRIIGLRTKEDTLVIPSHFLGYAVTKLGGTEKQIDISESYHGNNSNEFRGFANKIRMWNIDEKQRLKKIIISEGIEKITDTGFAYAKVDEIILPESLTSIDRFSFHRCFIDKITIKNPELTIGLQAFSYSTLKEIVFPKHFKGLLEPGCFSDSSIETFHCPENGLVSGIFENCTKLNKIIFPENQKKITIPSRSFFGCTSLKKLEFPASTGSVVLEQCDYADNFKKGGVETLVFHGKATKIKCIPLMGKSDLYSNFITAGRIIAPKGSAAIRTAKRSKKIGYLPPKLKKEILDGNSPNCYTDLEYMNVRLVPMEYSYL